MSPGVPPSPLSMQWDDSDIVAKPKQRSPWVLAGAVVTAGVLVAGVLAFRSGNTQLSQHMMRARVVAQGVTVAIMAGSVGGVLNASRSEGEAASAAAAK